MWRGCPQTAVRLREAVNLDSLVIGSIILWSSLKLTMLQYLLLSLTSGILFGLGALASQLSAGLTNPLGTIGLIIFFSLGGLVQAIAMRIKDMGSTYILIVGLDALFALLFSIFIFKETYTALKLSGMFFILIGCVFLTK